MVLNREPKVGGTASPGRAVSSESTYWGTRQPKGGAENCSWSSRRAVSGASRRCGVVSSCGSAERKPATRQVSVKGLRHGNLYVLQRGARAQLCQLRREAL